MAIYIRTISLWKSVCFLFIASDFCTSAHLWYKILKFSCINSGPLSLWFLCMENAWKVIPDSSTFLTNIFLRQTPDHCLVHNIVLHIYAHLYWVHSKCFHLNILEVSQEFFFNTPAQIIWFRYIQIHSWPSKLSSWQVFLIDSGSLLRNILSILWHKSFGSGTYKYTHGHLY
jgi:hypothetical protein